MESTLSLKLVDLQGEVGLFLGYGRGADNGDVAWSTSQTAAITSIVKSGLRQFYYPPPLEGVTDSSYDWSFLKPVTTLGLAAGTDTLQMPDDFGGFEGQITVPSATSRVPWAVDLVGEGAVRSQYAVSPAATGRPLLAALRPKKGTTALGGQRFELFVYPTPDADYPIQFAYYVLPDYLSGAYPYAYGGMAHAETILESCLAIAEQRLDDSSAVHSAKFQERLAASISLDRRNKPQTLGYNGDRSDCRERGLNRHYLNFGGVTVNGVVY